MIKRILLIIPSFFFLFILFACTDEQHDEPEADIIRFGLTSAPVTLDPLQATDATSARINRLIYQRLVEFGADNKPIPGIATWKLLDAKHYRFTLTGKSVFHHGHVLTANDVKATYDALLDPKTASPHRNALKHILRIEVLDERTLDFFLTRSDPLFPAFLAVGILPADALKQAHTFNQQPIGSGQFEFLRWPFDGQLFLRRKSDQQVFEFLKVKNPTVRVLKLLRGELDLIQNDLPPEHIAFLKSSDEIQFLTESGANYSYLGFNLQDKDTGQQKLRSAIAYALDRDKIIQYALGNAAQKANGFFPAQHWAGARLKSYDYDPIRAVALMLELGYSEKKHLKLVYKTSSDPFRIRIATIIQSQLKDIFIDVEIRSYDWGTFYGDIKNGQFQMYSLTWVGIKTPDVFRQVFHSHSLPPEGANRGRLNNPKIDQMIELAEQEMDLQQQANLYQILQQELHQVLPYVSLWYEDNIAFYRKNIHGYQVSHDGNYDGLKNVYRSLNKTNKINNKQKD
ncbi:ABC transporter substrate-binding protein [sulfur-oxidizing endosymbiont of Gigantopelta aegis]|uniref:ABC transporter substrate-binding protein n=1 Tax=sulfur-oxidizing endosymbiont of Gigantopelta aegis TaxID=2794934 RepID=UPI001FEC461F|nr:ABC transporter substrate-binding protein [sulfur-oxidizing endosymbiont of Gigantopelta aegis]